MKQVIVIVIAALLVYPTAPVVYVLAGGGLAGGILCLLLGAVAYWAVGTALLSSIEFYRWVRDRRKPVEDTRLRVPHFSTYETDWTKINKDDRI